MNYLDYLKKKKDENDNSQSNTTTGNTSNNKSDSLLDAINGKNGNNDYLDYLNSQPVLGQEEEESQALHDMGNGEDVLSRWYDSASNATSKAYYENQNTAFDSLKNRADTISKYYQTADALKGSAKQFYDKYGYTDDSSDMQSAISDLNIAEDNFKANAKEIQNAMSDFDTEQEYKSAVTQAEEDAKTSDDLQNEYDKKKAEYDSTWGDFNKEYAEMGGSYNNNPFTTQGKKANKKLQERTNQRAKLGELQKKIDQKKELENEKKYYTDFRKQNPEVAKTLDAYYDMQSYEEEHSKDALDTYNKEVLKEKLKKGKLPTDSLYTDEEKKAIETNFNSLKTLDGWNVDQIYKYYKRAKDREKAEKENENIKDFADKHPIASTAISTLNMIPSAFESSPKQVASNIDKWTGGDGYYNPEESAVYQNNLLQQEVASNIDNPLGRLAYQQGVSLVDNAIRMGIAYANPAVGLSMMGAEVATQGFDDTIENGGSVEQALFTGLAYAGIEVLTESVSLGKLKSFKKSSNATKLSILKNAGKQILTEAGEEVSATLLDTVVDEVINGSLSQLETEYDKYIDSGMSETEAGQAVMLNYGGQIIQDAIGGALMGGISGTAVNTSQYRRNIKAGKSISSLDNIDTIKTLAKHYGLNDSVTDYESNPTDAKLGALQSEAYDKATESMPSEKEFKKVIKKANLVSDEKVVANKLTNGENLTDDDLEKIKKSESLKSLLASDVVNQAKTARFNQKTALLSADTKLFTPSLIEFNSEKSDADASSNKTETLDKFLSENAKNMTINTDTVDKMKDAYNGLEDKVEPDIFAMEYARFYNQGVRAVAFQSLNSTVSQLPYNVQVSAYEDGLNKYTTALKAGNALSKLQQEWKEKTNGYAKGTVDTSALEGIELNDEQKATANYISKFADFGLNVKLYASQADENGNFSLENGAYNSTTNTVSIDLNAKRKTVDQALKQGAIIATFGHELTHIAEHAPTEYTELTKAIRDTVGTDIFNATVDKHRSILEDYNSKSWQKMSESEKEISATKEAIAEFSSDLVNQSKILEKMSKENPSAGKKFINAIKNVIDKIKKFITGDRGKTEEARLLESTAKDLQGIVDKYEKAVIEGLKNQNTKIYAKKSSTESNNSIEENNTEIQNNTRSGSFLSDSEVDNQYSQAVKNNDIETAQKLIDEKAMSWGAYSEDGKTPTKLYHGTESFGFTAFDLSKMDDGASIFLTNKPEIASTYSGVETENNIQYTINSIKAISSKVKSMSIYEVEKSLNSLTHDNTNPELRADNDDLHYSIVDKNAVNKLTAKVNSEIDYLIDYLKGREGYFKKFPKIDYNTKYSDFVEMLKNRQYNKISNPLFNLIESTKFDSTEEEQKFRKIEKDSYGLVRILEVYNNFPIIISKDSQGTIFGVFNENKAKDYLKGKLTEQVQKGNYSLFAKIGNPLIIDASKSNWNEIDVKSVINTPFGDAIKADYGEDYFDYGTQYLSTREVSNYAKQAGYDGVIFKSLKDNGGRNRNVSLDTVSDVYIAFNPNNVKSADPVTYNDNGDVLSLSERFNIKTSDIRYNLNTGEFISTREALAQALKTANLNKSEQNVIKSYQEGLEQMGKLNDKANELANKIKVIKAKDRLTKDDRVQIESLKKSKFELDDKIASKDKTLLKLESTEAMRSLLKHETAKKIARVREQKNERYNDMLKQKSEEKKEALAKQRENQKGNKNLNTIKKYAKKLQNMVMHPTDSDYVPYGLNEPIKQITGTLLNSMNLENGTELSEQLSKVSRKLKEINKSDEHYGDFHNAYDEDLIEMIDVYADLLNNKLGDSKIQKKNSKNNGLTNSELADIAKIVKEIYTATKTATKQLGRNDVKTNYESGSKIIEQTKALGNIELNAMDTLLEQVLSPMRLMAKYTGYNDNAELMYHINALNEGTQKYNMFKMIAEKPLNEYIKANQKEYENFKTTPVEFEYNDRKGQKQKIVMTKSQALQILMSYERERQSGGKMEHIMRGGITLLDAEQLKKGNYAKAFEQRKNVTGITASFLISLEKKMGDFENGYRKLAENLFNEVSKKYINDTSSILKHRDIAGEGYYIPFAVNREFLNTEIDGLKYDATIANKGMLHDTKVHAPQAINIAGLDSVINKHIRDVGQYYGYAIPIRNFNKVLNMKVYEKNSDGKKIQTDSVRTALRTTFNSDKPITFIEQTLKDLQTSRTPLNGTEKTINKIIKGIRSNMITSALNGSVSVVIKQGASLYTASSILSFNSVSVGMAKGIRQITHKGGWKSLTDEIDAHTAGHYMRRIGLSSMEIEEMANSWLGKKLPTALNPTKWIQGTDCITTALHWVACKEEISRQYKESGKADKIGSEEYFNEVTKVYDRVLEETQPMYDSLHRGEIQKNSNELLKSVFMFKTQPLQNTGIIYDAIMDYQANKGNESLRVEKKKKLAKAVSSQMVSAFTFVAMTFIASLALHKPERYKDENDEVTLGSIIKRMGIDWLETGASVLVPIGGSEIASYVENQINGKDYDFASDNVVSMLNDFTSSIGDFNEKCIVALAKGEFDLGEATSAFWNLSVDALALFKGFPLKNYGNIINGVFKNIGDAISGNNTYFGSSGGRKGSEYANSYDVLIDNNPEKAKQQLETFYNEKYEEQITKGESTTEAKKKAQTSVRTALTTQYKKEYQKAFLNNDRDTMQKISKKLQKSGYMKWDGKSLSTVLGEWTKSAQEDLSK